MDNLKPINNYLRKKLQKTSDEDINLRTGFSLNRIDRWRWGYDFNQKQIDLILEHYTKR